MHSIKKLSQVEITNLINNATDSPLRRSRILLHESLSERVHQMVIAIHDSSEVPMHRHPKGKAESYLVLHGCLSVRYFNDEGELIDLIEYLPYENSAGFFFGRHQGGTWHQPFVKEGWAIYLETYEGPFNKEIDVELFAS